MHLHTSFPNSILRLRVLLLILAVALGLGAPRALGQADQGSIFGAVTDPTGASVPNAKVTVSNPATGFTFDTTTDASGNYVFSPIKVGTYTVTASAAGFSSVTQTNITVNANARAQANITLNVSGASQTVTVTAAPPALQTNESSTGQVVSSRAINATPLNGRNFVFIAQTSAGVVPGNPGARGLASGDFSANGQRAEQNNFIIDGVDNNSNLVDFLNGASYVIQPPPDALQEFRVQTGDYTAELGHSAGAVLNVVTKGGTNNFHGDLWEYFRNDVLNAKDYFESVVPKYRQNQFGATIGGPFIKNKLFFFADAQANRIVFGQHAVYSVPTALMRTGDFTELLNPGLTGKSQPDVLYQPGGPTRAPNGAIISNNYLACNGVQNVICPAAISRAALAVLNAYPAPNVGVPGQTYNNYLFQGEGSDNTTQYDGRVDWTIGPKDNAFARYSYRNEPVYIQPPLGILDGGGFGGSGTTENEGRNFTASETHVFTPTLVNEFRIGYNWLHAAYLQANSGADVSSQFGIGGIPFGSLNGGLPYMAIGGLSTVGSPQYEPSVEGENVAELLDNLTKELGNHSLKFGVELEDIRLHTLQPIDPRGTFNLTGQFTEDPSNPGNTGFGAADFLLDSIYSSSLANQFTALNQRWYRGAYVQDDWKVTPQLTLNLGVRYEYFQPWVEVNGDQANFVPDYANDSGTFLLTTQAQRNGSAPLTPAFLTALAKNNIAVAYTNNRSLVNSDYKNVSPRIGFAYSVNDKTVVRGGYGIFYGGLESVGYYPNLAQNFPFQYDSNFQSSNFGCVPGACPTNGQTLETGFSAAIAAGLANFVTQPGLRSYVTNTQTPYSEEWNLALQRAITNDTTATVAYVGTVGRHLQSNPDVNAVPELLAPGSATQSFRPYNQFGGSSLISYGGASNYNSLQATLQRRMSRNLTFLAAYTYSHALDDAFLPLGGTGQSGSGYRNWRQLGFGYDYGSSFFDTRQRFSLNGQWTLPAGVGQRYLNRPGVLNEVAGGWAVSMFFRTQTGQPETVLANNNPTGLGGGTAFAYGVAPPFAAGGTPTSSNSVCATRTRSVGTWINPCSFANPPIATATGQSSLAPYGPPDRTMLYGPGYNRADISAFKSFSVYRETNLQFRADIFNLYNTPAFGQPGNTLGSGFGQITSERFGGSGTAGETPDARVVQFALTYMF